MEEGRKVSVVRCPKCQKLIAEPPDVLVYRCGRCGAILQAENRLSAGTDAASDEERAGFCDNFESYSGKSGTVLSETKRESNGVEVGKRERFFLERMAHSSSSPLLSRSENGDVLNECSGSRWFGEPETSGYDQGRYRRSSKAPVVNGVATESLSSHLDELMRTNVKGNGDGVAPNENATGFQKFGQMPDRRAAERDGSFVFHREGRGVEGSWCSGTYPDEGPSDHHVFSGEKMNNQKLEGSDSAETVEKNRAELLRKLDELRNQLIRPGDVSGNLKEEVLSNKRTVPTNLYNVPEPRFTGVSLANGSSSQLDQDNSIRRPLYYNNGQPAPLMGGHGMNVQKSYPLRHPQNDIHGYMEPFGPQVPRRAPHQPQTQYPQRSSNDYFSGHCMETVPDPFIRYPPYGFYEQPPCSCLHCHNKLWQMPRQAHPAIFCDPQLPIAATTNHMEYHLDNPSTCCTRVYNRANAPSDCFEPQAHVRKPTDLEYDMGGFRRLQPQRFVFAKGNKRTCRPIADGAPFITCCNCSKLLQLPSEFSLRERNQCKLRCGSCSNTISFTFDGKRLVFSHASQIRDLPLEADEDSSDMMKEGLHVDGYTTNGILNSNLDDDYDISIYNIQSGDARPISSPSFALSGDDPMGKESMLNSSESEKRRGLSSSSTSEDEEYSYGIITQRDVTNSPMQPLEEDISSPVAGLRLHEHFEHSPANQVMEKVRNGNRSKRSDQGSVLPTKITIRQSSVKDASVATEIDCLYNEISSSTICQDFVVAKKEDHRHSKGGESFFVGLIKSFRDFGRPNQPLENDQYNVSINGHPIPVRLVRKAEKKAGRILPGHYWYDYQAGFWGVMGHQCLGMIPPFIEEFNYPLPKNCSGGDTGVFVNARELDQTDLDLLSARGLPITRDKSYLVEISGRVFDEATGEELDNLGKLAPTVERWKHGFGMWPLGTMSSDIDGTALA